MNWMVLPNQVCLIVKLYNNRPGLLPDSNDDKYQMVYIPDMGSDTIRICIPHFDKLEKYDFHLLISAINEINRKVKYVKIVVLKNGSISINYDHKYCGRNNNIDVILSHILQPLCFVANTLKAKLSRQTSF